ncbi:MAG: malto-oligosyltrehalose synthase [Sulfuricaulis sp.]
MDGGLPPRSRIPTATYRLQFHRGFTFVQAAALVPYLQRLGISHCYASPYLKARAGSSHGYDIVDHNALNPEIGSREDYERFVETLHEYGMGQILDIVPNHMGVFGHDNRWWQDVLENGQASVFACYFDIDWHPPKDDLRLKVLSPVFGDHYGKLLESGEIKVIFDTAQGEFAVHYHSHRFPIDPQTYPRILSYGLERLDHELSADHPTVSEFRSLVTALRNLPLRSEADKTKIQERRHDKEVHKRHLAQMAHDSAEILRLINDNVALFNGTPGEPSSFDLLHELLEAQAYRLASWRVASDEINYRRFFDVNDLAGLHTENPEVFDSAHRMILRLVEEGKIDGLRIDHPDGLYDPAQYYERLCQRVSQLTPTPVSTAANDACSDDLPLYVVTEKILASHEHLPEGWRVHGTTGYDFANLVNGLMVNASAERQMKRIYLRFAGPQPDRADMLYECKSLVMRTGLSSELYVLTNYLDRISESDRLTRDFTHSAQRAALFEVVACFPVYRTYVTNKSVTEEDRRYVEWAIAAAKRRSAVADVSIFDFIREILLLENLEKRDQHYRNAVVEFTMRFQQYTAPVMAKGLEDTMFYRHNLLTSLNEVGGNPHSFGVSIAAFHHANMERQRRWPHGLLCTSSHDTKRSEDVRARLNVLSEIPSEWREHVALWSRINRSKKRRLDNVWAPSQNDEYLFYQTILGIWPSEPLNTALLTSVRDRVEAYMLKAIREAKVHTSWINPNPEYEKCTLDYVRMVLSSTEHNMFFEDFLAFHKRVGRFGMLNGLSQVLLKLTSPGVPDIYQGTEIWNLSLVDPDNRRNVDYDLLERMSEDLSVLSKVAESQRLEYIRGMLDHLEDGRAKLFLTSHALSLRGKQSDCFNYGEYLPLSVHGPRADQLCGFATVYQERAIVTAAPRWFSRLMNDGESLPSISAWAETWLEAPVRDCDYINIFTGEKVRAEPYCGKTYFPAKNLFAHFPVALLNPV